MKKAIISILIAAAVLFAADFYAFKGLAQPFVESHQREFMGNWFTGNWADWIGLIIFNIIVVLFSIGVVKEPDFYEEVGSSAKGIIFFFVLPIASLVLIYIG